LDDLKETSVICNDQTVSQVWAFVDLPERGAELLMNNYILCQCCYVVRVVYQFNLRVVKMKQQTNGAQWKGYAATGTHVLTSSIYIPPSWNLVASVKVLYPC
jgi:hypothetical protein